MDHVISSSPPMSPHANDVWADDHGRHFVWTSNSDGSGQWVQVPSARPPQTVAVHINSPPLSPRANDVWADEYGRHFVWTLNSDGYGQWVQVPTAPPPTVTPLAPPITNATPKCTSSAVPPLSPLPNDLWFDTTSGFFFIFYNDGNTYQWVVTNPGRGSDVVPPSAVAPVQINSDPGIVLTPDPIVGLGSVGVDTAWFDARVASEIPANLPPSGAAGGDLAGSYPNPVVKASVALGGNPTATTQATSDSSQRLATTAFVKTNIAALPAPPTTLPPSGTAGGDLTGTYPNPTLVGGPLSNYELLSHKGAVSGYAPLDATTKVPAAYLPAYVDDVLEFANLAAFPATGLTGVIYVALDTNKVYRWSGSVYVEISPSPGSTDAVPEGATNKYYTDERVDDRVDALIVDGLNITTTYNDAAGTLTIAAAAYPTSLPGPPTGAAGGDLSGTYPNPLLKPSVTNGQLMTTVAGVAAWAAPPSTAPSGAAGGDLSGTYPNPTIKPSVTNGQVMTTVAGVAAWAAASGGGAATAVGTTPPGSPTDGQLWYYSDAVNGGGTLYIRYNDGNTTQWVPASPAPINNAAVVRTTKFTTPGTTTWTPNANMVYAKAQGWGAGGAGGSTASGTGSTASINGGGGAAGSWAKIIISKATAGASQVVTIGAAAAQPAAGNVNGGAGGDTSLGSLLVAKGGPGGLGSPAAGANSLGGLGVAAGNVGDESGPGMSGGSGYAIGGGITMGSNIGGSATPIGSGGRGINAFNSQGNGEAAIGFASGGSGASSYGGGAAQRGGVGTGGYLVIEEYCTA